MTPVAERAAVVARAGEILDQRKDEFGRLMTLEMGKPLKAAVEEAAKCALACRYYAEHASAFTAPERIDDGESPLPAARRRARDHAVELPVLAGHPVRGARVMRRERRHSQARVERSAVRPRDRGAVHDAGAPDGVFQTLLIGSDRVESIIADRRIAAVTLTGSEPAGRQVAATAGQHIKKTVLELGGSDPFIVMPSADVAAAADVAVKARTINNGQSCIAAKRFIVHENVADEFTTPLRRHGCRR